MHDARSIGAGKGQNKSVIHDRHCGRDTAALPETGENPFPFLRSVNDHRLLGQAGVALEGVFNFLLGGRVLLPRLDVHLEHFCPRAI